MVYEVFHDFDTNHDNQLDRNELLNILKALGDKEITKYEVGIMVYYFFNLNI